ncbi:Restriction endonuclease NotI [Nitrosospira briensis]|uniref:Restriction endonuclease NotI n=1 Tax=Nitrosospira briensis TaxID=35799 RepID=A0A1I4XIB7_9PROT|nr:NotI family restriction endonuclease [Nitrosospira briensis]SFN25000.1 Restriction endonuclease NotI [Nitrosospira briensis]
MASTITEFFGYSPLDKSLAAQTARDTLQCPFLERTCVKTLSDGSISGVCTLKPMTSGPVICCPIRLYSGSYKILHDVTLQSFGDGIDLVIGGEVTQYRAKNPGKPCIAVFGKRWGKELRLPSRAKSGAYFVDWILAHVDPSGRLLGFVAIEVQSIDTTGNYQAERSAHLAGIPFAGSSTAGFNWENVNKRILPQIIYKGHVLRREPLCHKGLFFICPTPVYKKIAERLGGSLTPIHQQSGAVTMMWYDVGPPVPDGQIRSLELIGQYTTTVDQVALAFTAPSNLPPPKVYEQAIIAEL